MRKWGVSMPNSEQTNKLTESCACFTSVAFCRMQMEIKPKTFSRTSLRGRRLAGHQVFQNSQKWCFTCGCNLRQSYISFKKNSLPSMYIYIYIYSKLSVSGMHRSLAKQDACTANVNLEILPVNETPVSGISERNLQIFV